MTLRTPRRRISPRTKRRYRAIKDFLRRAIGSPSQPDIKINSSIAINVTDLKHKIVGLEQTLSEVNKHCRDLVCLECSSQKESQTLVQRDERHDLSSLKEQTENSSTKEDNAATTLLYKTSESHYRKSDDSNSIEKNCNDTKRRKAIKNSDVMAAQEYDKETKVKKKRSRLDHRIKTCEESHPNLHKHKTRSAYETVASTYGATTSYHSLMDNRSRRRRNQDHEDRRFEEPYVKKHEFNEPVAFKEMKAKKHKVQSRKNSPERYPEQYGDKSRHKSKRNANRQIDEDFIADIIRRQYIPTKRFGKRESDISQFSAPVCRDQEYPVRENILEGSELCSCCYDGHNKSRYEYDYDVSDMRSICDTRLYSNKRQTRHRHHQKYADYYNDSNQYDLIPVKENNSPKTRRKFVESANIPGCVYYKEVPPSPRTHRPRLNLKAQYYNEFEDYVMYKKHRLGSPRKFKKHLCRPKNFDSNESSVTTAVFRDEYIHKAGTKNPNDNHIQQNVGTMSSLQSPVYMNEPVNVTRDSTFNKTQETESSTDKTDKALTEIKDILQNFLQEIKKETTVSQFDNSEINTTKVGDSAKLNTTILPNSGLSVNNYSGAQCSIPSPFIPALQNPCCYPVLPVCPMNCMQNGYIMPSPSFTCASCANNVKEDVCQKNTTAPNESNDNVTNRNNTDELIKQIYKLVSQSPESCKKEFRGKLNNKSPRDARGGKMLTSRSVGGSSKLSRHDAQVETQKIKCQSKSCEAIGSRFISDTSYSRTNPSYSDTILERLSLEAATGSESEYSSESTNFKKGKKNRFAKVLQTLGLFKKKKDVIEELSESESTVEVQMKAKKPPFRQEVMNYMCHQQEFYNRPPSPPGARHQFPTDCRHGYGCHVGCPEHLNHINPMHYDPYHSLKMGHGQDVSAAYRSTPHRPSAPPYPDPYEGHVHNQPQVPLCLKEIEVKSIGTQSERKMTLFSKFTKKVQRPTHTVPHKFADAANNCSTQTAQEKPGLFNFKAQMAMAKERAQMAKERPQSTKERTQMAKGDKPATWNWKTLQAKVNQLEQPDAMKFSMKTQKQLAEGDIKMRNAMLKKLFYKRNPFSPRNLIVRTILGKDKSSYGEPPMMYRPRMFF